MNLKLDRNRERTIWMAGQTFYPDYHKMIAKLVHWVRTKAFAIGHTAVQI